MQEINQQKGSPDYQIRKGARSNIVCYYNTTPIKDEETGEPMIDEFTGKELRRGFLKYYRVFSKTDIVRKDNGESLPSKFHFEHFSHEEATEQMKQALDRFNRLVNYYCKKHGIEVQVCLDGTQAYFSHNMKIKIPDISNFDSIYNWVHTVAHEIAHSTGMLLGRFNDQEPKAIEDAMKSYSKEELIMVFGLQRRSMRKNTTATIRRNSFLICTRLVQCYRQSILLPINKIKEIFR